jgi:hypothetical protein
VKVFVNVFTSFTLILKYLFTKFVNKFGDKAEFFWIILKIFSPKLNKKNKIDFGETNFKII